MEHIYEIYLKSIIINNIYDEFFEVDSLAYKLNESFIKYVYGINDMFKEIVEQMKEYVKEYQHHKDNCNEFKKFLHYYLNGIEPLPVFSEDGCTWNLQRILGAQLHSNVMSIYRNDKGIIPQTYTWNRHYPASRVISYLPSFNYNYINYDFGRSDKVYQYISSKNITRKNIEEPVIVQAINLYGGSNPIKLFRQVCSMTGYMNDGIMPDHIKFIFYIDNSKYNSNFDFVIYDDKEFFKYNDNDISEDIKSIISNDKSKEGIKSIISNDKSKEYIKSIVDDDKSKEDIKNIISDDKSDLKPVEDDKSKEDIKSVISDDISDLKPVEDDKSKEDIKNVNSNDKSNSEFKEDDRSKEDISNDKSDLKSIAHDMIEKDQYIGVPVIVHDPKAPYFDILTSDDMLVKTATRCYEYKAINSKWKKMLTDKDIVVLVPTYIRPYKCKFNIQKTDILKCIYAIMDICGIKRENTSILIANERNDAFYGRTVTMNFAYNKYKKNYIFMFQEDDDLHLPLRCFDMKSTNTDMDTLRCMQFYCECEHEIYSNLLENEKISLQKYINQELPIWCDMYIKVANHITHGWQTNNMIFPWKSVMSRCFTSSPFNDTYEDVLTAEFYKREGTKDNRDNLLLMSAFYYNGAATHNYFNALGDHYVRYKDILKVIQISNYYLKTGIYINPNVKRNVKCLDLIDDNSCIEYITFDINGYING